MKKVQKTYGVYNLMEWQCTIGGTTINFTGGAFTGYGVRPAQYTTKELFLQTLIEKSPHFTKGRIKLIKSIPTDEDIIVQSPPKEQEPVSVVEEDVVLPASGVVSTTADESETATAATQLLVSDRDDAVKKLHEQYGIAIRRLTSRASILSEASAAGVTLVGWPNE